MNDRRLARCRCGLVIEKESGVWWEFGTSRMTCPDAPHDHWLALHEPAEFVDLPDLTDVEAVDAWLG